MNYKCNCCGYEFDEPHVYYESHGFTDGFYERFSCCPNCGGDYTDDFEVDEADDCETTDPTEEEDCECCD